MSSPEIEIEKERLITRFHPRRISALFYYVFGILSFLVGLLFMIMSSANYVESDFVAWYIGLWAIVLGSLTTAWAEIRRRYTLYIVTTWNVRTRSGYRNKVTRRVFYDEIDHVGISRGPDEEVADEGAVKIYVAGNDEPEIVFTSVGNPYGIVELISRFVNTIPDPVPWSHIDRTRIAPF